MASSSEIEKLERRCAENPHGLTFAPLAEAYRKQGDLDRALEVLRAGRELHPDYIPASIVLGRCHLDRGELADAERAFAHVLTLDPENVIALKALADLAEREGRGVQAERWLNLLLSVDPSNEDATAQLGRIRDGGAAAAQRPATEAPAPEALTVAAEPAPAEAPAADYADEPVADYADEPVDEPAGPEPVPAHSVMSTGGEAAPADLDISVEIEEEIVLTPAAESDYRAEVPGALPDPVLEAPDEVADPFAGAEDAVGDDADDYRFDPSDAAASGLEPVPDLMAEFGSPDGDADDAYIGAASEPEGLESLYPAAGPEPEPVITESMAELYLRQGHRAGALAIYRELAARRPGDARIDAVIAQLAEEVDSPPPSAPAYAASATGGRSVADLLRGILAERLPPAPPAPEPFPADAGVPEFRSRDEVLNDADDQGEPTRPAEDHLTLGAVFGEEDGGAPPAVASPDAGGAEQDGLSFDEFFGAPPAIEPDATRTSPPPPSGDPDDLDQFHAWLQSLKR